jgi:glycosyltransferase involved in cell wall biosynthesis
MPEYRRAFYENLLDLGKRDGVQYIPSASRAPLDARGRGDEISKADFFTFAESKESVFGNRSIVRHKLSRDWMDADLIIAEHAIRNLVAFKWCYMRRPMRFAFWGHGRTYTKVKTGLEESLKARLLRRADWYFAYTLGGAQAVGASGFSRDHITIVQNSTDTSLLEKLRGEVTDRDVRAMRDELGLYAGRVAVFIGGLDESKRLDFIVAAAQKIAAAHPDFKVVFFGAGSQQHYIETQAAEHSWVVYGGRADAQMQAVVSKIADFIVMPGRVGLVAVDSFALELPMVTTRWPLHAPEFEYLEDGVNAVVTRDDIEDYVAAIIGLLEQPERLKSLKSNCAKSAKEYSIENMARNFHQGVLEALAMPSRKK